VIPWVESVRERAPRTPPYTSTFAQRFDSLVLNPLFTNAFAQSLGGAIIYPFYWASFISSTQARKWPSLSPGSAIPQIPAESNLVSFVLGFVIPGVAMKYSKNTTWSLIWWFFPFTTFVYRGLYSYVRTRFCKSIQSSTETAYWITQATYLVGFLYATIFHLIVLVPMFYPKVQWAILKALLGPTLSAPSPSTDLPWTVLHILQYDAILIFGSAVVATLVGFARTKKEAVRLAVWNVFAIVFCGTGGAIAGVWMWREQRLKREREEIAQVKAASR